jgi:hypothetical protein
MMLPVASRRVINAYPAGRITQHPTVPAIGDRPRVLVRVAWDTGQVETVPGRVHAWTREAVLVHLTPPSDGMGRPEWFHARDVRRDQATLEH